MKLRGSKIFLTISIIIVATLFFVGFLFRVSNETNKRVVVERLKQAVRMVDDAPEIPSALNVIHQYVMEEFKKGNIPLGDITEIKSEAKTNPEDYPAQYEMVSDILYINPYLNIRSEIWIPILYHELTHKWERNKYYVNTPKQHWEESIFELESTAYTTIAQAWALVGRYYPIKEEGLTKEEKVFVKSFKDISDAYNELQAAIKKEDIDLEKQEGWDKLQKTEAWQNWTSLIQSQIEK